MNFPQFGDAGIYSEIGAACANALTSAQGNAFAGCYNPIRPVGMIALSTVPYLVTRDPVEVAYVALALNLVLFVAAYGALLGIFLSLRGAPREGPSPGLLAVVVFVPFVMNAAAHVPVTLADLPSLAFFLLAMRVGAAILGRGAEDASAPRLYLLAGLLAAGAALLKQNYFIFAFGLLASTALLDRRRLRGRMGIRCVALFLLGLSLVLVQFANVYAHSGSFWLYEADYLYRSFPRRPSPAIEAIAFNLPAQGAFMVKVTNEVSYPTFIVLKLFRGLFRFEWAVYLGEVSRSREFWTLGRWDFVGAYGLVGLYGLFTAWAIRRGPAPLALLNINAVLVALFTAVLGHTEIRYYMLPRIALAATLLYHLFALARRAAAGSPGARGGHEQRSAHRPGDAAQDEGALERHHASEKSV